jgi:hypothetical protein
MRSSAPKRQTLGQLRKLQRLTGSVIFRPLTPDFQTQTVWKDGSDTHDFVTGFIKPNDRLTSFERLQIYNRQYWFRLIDSLYDDYPGLLSVLEQDKFSRLTRAYLAKYPSRSFSLRNLGSSLVQFLTDEPKWASPYEQMALDMAKFEWAQIIAFDGPAKPPLTASDLTHTDPSRLRLGLQPYLSLLDMAYPLDDFSISLKKHGLRTEASNATSENQHAKTKRRVPRPRRKRTFVAVHRLNNDLYYKRLEPAAYALLTALAKGLTLIEAIEAAAPREKPDTINRWFAGWMEVGWFCRPDARKKRG